MLAILLDVNGQERKGTTQLSSLVASVEKTTRFHPQSTISTMGKQHWNPPSLMSKNDSKEDSTRTKQNLIFQSVIIAMVFWGYLMNLKYWKWKWDFEWEYNKIKK